MLQWIALALILSGIAFLVASIRVGRRIQTEAEADRELLFGLAGAFFILLGFSLFIVNIWIAI